MTGQLDFFSASAAHPTVDVAPRRSTLPAVYEIPEVCVLRDWMLGEGVIADGLDEPCKLIDLAPERALAMAALAWGALIEHLRASWRSSKLCFPRGGALRRLSIADLERGVSLHLEALQHARRWRLATHRVRTQLVGDGKRGVMADVALFLGSILGTSRVADLTNLRPESRIPLVRGWQAAQRRGAEFPWDPPPPGWVIDRRAGRLVRATRESWVPRATHEAANLPVVIDVRELVSRNTAFDTASIARFVGETP